MQSGGCDSKGGGGERWMEQFMMEKGKLISTLFEFLVVNTGGVARSECAGGRNGPPTLLQAGENPGGLLLLKVRDYANGLNKSLAYMTESSRLRAGALFFPSGKMGPSSAQKGASLPPTAAVLSLTEETKRGWSPIGIYPPRQENRSRLLLDNLHRFVKLLPASAWMASTEQGGKG